MDNTTPKTWHPVWERIFSSRESWNKYPPEELVRFVAGHYYSEPARRNVRILEIGCGPGGGPSWYIAREGFSFSGIDGSTTAIEKAKARFRANSLDGEFVVGDLALLPWDSSSFDAVVDVACLQCNCEADTGRILAEVLRVLKPGGRHFSLTAKAGCWGTGTGERVDETSVSDVKEGPYAEMGVMRFATSASLAKLYAAFRELNLEYSIRSMRGGTVEISNWILTCAK
jgi:SAM-dependent methyltransferase